MSDQHFKAHPIRPGFPYSFPIAPLKTVDGEPAFPAGSMYESRITTDLDDAANGGVITSAVGQIVVEDNQLTLNFPAEVTAALETDGASTVAAFDIVRVDPGNESHLNITVEIPVVPSITPPPGEPTNG